MTFKPGESGNVKGRPPKSSPGRQPPSSETLAAVGRLTERFDSWTNFVTAMGTGRDKRTHSWFSTDVVTDTEAMNLWRGDDICKRAIEAVPKTAFRRGFTLKVQDKELAEKTQAALEDLEIVEHFVKAGQYENAYGGAALFPVFENATDDLEEPLDLAAGNLGRLVAFHLLEPRELWPKQWYTSISDKKFRQPSLWNLVPINSGGGGYGVMMQPIHESRLIIFPGRRMSSQYQAYQRPGWGDTCLTGIYPIIRDFGSAWGHVAALLQDFAQAVLSLKDYAALMKEDGGEAIVKARLRLMDEMRSTMRMMVMDKEDTFSRQQTPMTGLSDLLHDFALRIAAAVEQPVTVLFGMAPAGLNATGDNDIRGWYDGVAAHREHNYKRKLEAAIRLYFLSNESASGGKEPDMWSTEFPPLWEPTEKERADTRLAIAQADQIYAVQIQACTSEDVAESRWKGDTFSAEMTIDWDARAKQQAAEEKMAKEAQAHELELAKAQAGGDGPVPPEGGAPVPPVVPPEASDGAGERRPVPAKAA